MATNAKEIYKIAEMKVGTPYIVTRESDDDICHCLDDGCPDKDRCYRYAIRGRVWSNYAATLRDPETGRCEYFIPIQERHE